MQARPASRVLQAGNGRSAFPFRFHGSYPSRDLSAQRPPLRRNVGGRRGGPATLAEVRRPPRRGGAGRDARAARIRRPADPGKRRHLQRLCRPQGLGPAVGARPAAADHPARRMGRGFRRRGAACDPAQRDAGRPLRRAEAAFARAAAAGAGVRAARLPVALSGHQAAGRRLAAPLRGRPGALAGWPLVGAWPTARRRLPAPVMRWKTG